MKIGIIIPYFPDDNTYKLHKRCLDSIGRKFVVINQIDEFNDGVSITRNFGLIEAQKMVGLDYISFLDADDTLNPDAYEQMCEAIVESQFADMIQLNHQRQKEDSKKWIKYFNKAGQYELNNLPKFWFAVWNKLYKANLLEYIRFIPRMNYGEDELFNLECLAKTRRIYCSERFAMTHHFDNPNSLSKQVTIKELAYEQNMLVYFAERYKDDNELLSAVRQRQIELWSSSVYKQFFGGAS